MYSFPGVQFALLRIFGPTFPVGVTAVIEDESGKVLLFHHTYRGEYPWGLPGGWLKYREHPAACLAREVAEESGLRIEVGAPIGIIVGEDHPRIEFVYWARLMKSEFISSLEVDRAELFDPNNLPLNLRKYQMDVIKSYFEIKANKGLPRRFEGMPEFFGS